MQIFKTTGKEKFISSKNCRERWQNHLDKSKVKGNWTEEEDRKIIEFVTQNGKKWSKMRDLLQNKRTEHMIKNRYHSLITKNKAHRHEKEQQIAKRLQEKFEITRRSDVSQQQINPVMTDQIDEGNSICLNFKEQNLSDIAQECPSSESKAPERVEFLVKQQAENEDSIKQLNEAPPQAQPQKIQVKHQESNEPIGHYPFEHYNQFPYGHEYQYYDMHNAHLALICQQYMFAVAPTNDTYVADNNNPHHQPAQDETHRDI